MRSSRGPALALVCALVMVTPAKAQRPAVGDPTCAPVTLVTLPWSVVRIGGLGQLHAPSTVRLCPGAHAIAFTQDGYEPLLATVTVRDSSPLHFLFELNPLPGTNDAPIEPGLARDERVARAMRAYLDDGDATGASVDLEAALASGELAEADSMRAAFYLSLARYALGDVPGSRAAVATVTSIAPCLTPDARLTPPSLLLIYPGSTVARCRVGGARAVVLSAAIPGLSQVLLGDGQRGFLIGGGFLAAASVGVVLLLDAGTYYDEYLTTASPDRVEELYDKAAWRRTAGLGVVTGAAALYAWNLWDAWQMGRANVRTARPVFDYAGADGGVRVGVQVAF